MGINLSKNDAKCMNDEGFSIEALIFIFRKEESELKGNKHLKNQVEDFRLIHEGLGYNLKEIVKNSVNKIGNVNEYHSNLLNGYVNEEKIVVYDFRDGGIGSSGFCVSPYQNDDGTIDLVLESFSKYDGRTEYVGHFFVEDILNENFDEKQLYAVLYGNLIVDSKEFNEHEKLNDLKLSMDDFDRQYGYKTMLVDSVYPALEGYASLKTGILEVEDGFNLSYGMDITFHDALKYYGKTSDEFEKDCRLFYRKQKKIQNKENNDELER